MAGGRRIGWALVAVVLLWGPQPAPAAQTSDRIVYTTHVYGGRSATSEIFTVAPDGTAPSRLTRNRRFDLEPVWSPDRSLIAYVHHDEPRNPDVWVMAADGSDKRRLTRGPRDDEYPQWSPDGSRIAWLKTRGDSVQGEIRVMDADGSDKARLVRYGTWPQWSPDGTAIAFMHKRRCDFCSPDWEIRVVDVATGEVERLTDNRVDDVDPVWSPDGETIAFTRTRDDGGDLFTMSSDGSAQDRLTSEAGYAFAPDWSPDGSEIAFSLLVDWDDFDTQLAVVDVASKEVRRLTDPEAGGVSPDWSPDGGRIAFLTFFETRWEIAVIAPDGTGFTPVSDTEGDKYSLDW
ncbi:MAG TPA: hypothetical protein VEU29_08430 [Actinomycetota bacterium]|nr:hypothetical protein [Actinomycetota bacterium]